MHRRDFLKTGGAAAAGAAAATGLAQPDALAMDPAARADAAHVAHHLVLAAAWTTDWPGFAPLRLARRIEAVSGGRFRLDVVDAANAPRDAALFLGGAHDLATHHPAFSFFAGLPRGHALDVWDLPAWLAIGGGQMVWDELGAGFGIKPLLVGHSGPSAGLWSNRPLETVADLAGAGVCTTGLARDVVRALGALCVAVAPQEIAAALASGRALAAEWLGPLPAAMPGLRPLAPYLYAPGVTGQGAAFALTVRRDLWDGLDAAERAMLETCAAAEYQAALAEARAHAAIAAGMARPVRRLPLAPRLAGALDRATDEAVRRVAETDPVSRRIADSYRAFRDLLAAEPPATA
jgi:TRAP-type mannitol/chloroaromatic compound transport system substrate-binding protein